MAKKLLAPAIVLSLVSLSVSPALAANKVGDSCKVAGRVVTTSVQKLVCAKVAKNLKWVALTAPAATTTTVAPTTTVAATTTTTIAAVKPVVTLLRAGGTSTSPSVNYTVTGDKDLDCTTLSTVIGVDFATKYISAINSVIQTSAKVCTVNAQSRAARDNTAYDTVLSAAATFAIADTSGNVQTVLLGSPQTIWVTRAP
jgi:D-serine deaminase-like pyridoxal phosphate-dependent protein